MAVMVLLLVLDLVMLVLVLRGIAVVRDATVIAG
jgi:hypothetical protein